MRYTSKDARRMFDAYADFVGAPTQCFDRLTRKWVVGSVSLRHMRGAGYRIERITNESGATDDALTTFYLSCGEFCRTVSAVINALRQERRKAGKE